MTDKTPLTAHAGSRSWELRFGDEVMARVSTTFTMQAELAQQVTLRYNAHEGLLKLLREVLEWNEDDADLATNDTAFRLKNFGDTVANRSAALRAAIAKAEGRKP